MDSPKKSYGGGANRYVIMKVVNRDDPEQSGRLQVRVVGYQDDEGMIPDSDLIWARPMFPATNPMNGGVGGPVTGATVGSYLVGFFTDGNQHLHFTNSIGRAGKDDGKGGLDQSGTNSDTNPHTRDQEFGGGDFRYDKDGNSFDDKSVTKFARDESPNAFGKNSSKDASEEPSDSWSLAQHEYA